MAKTDEFVGLRQAERETGVSRVTLRRRIEDGRLPVFVRPANDRMKLIRRSDLEALMRPRPANATEPAAGVAAGSQEMPMPALDTQIFRRAPAKEL